MKNILLFVFTFLLYKANSQDITNKNLLEYYYECSNARYHFHKKEFTNCKNKLRNAFSKFNGTPKPHDEFCLSLSYANLAIYDSSFYFLTSSITNAPTLQLFHEYITYYNNEITIKDPQFNYINENKNYHSELMSLFKKKIQIKKGKINLKDSAVYYWINNMYYSENNNNSGILKREYYKRFIDTNIKTKVNLDNRIVHFIKAHKTYLGVSNVGTEVFISSILHLPNDRILEILPILSKEANLGNMTPNEYGSILERLNWNKHNDLCEGYMLMHFIHCDENDYTKIIANRNNIGVSVYLTEDDYSLNAFSKKNRIRNELPWVTQ